MIEVIAITQILMILVVVTILGCLLYLHFRLQGAEEELRRSRKKLEELADVLKPQEASVDSSENKPKKKNLQRLAKLIYHLVLKDSEHRIEVSFLRVKTGYSEEKIRKAAFESFQLHILRGPGEHAGYVIIQS